MNRRTFLTHLMAGAASLGAPALMGATRAQAASPAPRFSLDIVSRTLEVNGRAAKVFGLVQPDGKPGLTLDEGSLFDVGLTSRIDAPTLVHWHGLTPPWDQDGVPGNPAAEIAAGETRAYSFPVGQGGTFWMHAHTLQEQNLLAAPLIVRSAAERGADRQEVVILLHDFSFTPAEELLATLRGPAGTAPAGGMDHSAMGHGAMGGMPMSSGGMSMGSGGMGSGGMNHGGMSHGGMGPGGMGAMDLNDIAYDAYLANDRTLDDPEVVPVEDGGRVLLRVINGGAATAFTLSLGALEGELVAVDGKPVAPVRGRAFPLSMGQRVDIRLDLPKGSGAVPILALREGAPERTGIILAPPGAAVARLAKTGATAGPVLDLTLEQRLRPLVPLAPRAPDRRFAVTLTGTMAGYSWTIDGADVLTVKRGERVEISMRNMSMMAHPMHLHGHHFQVVAINGRPVSGAMRDTVLVPPMAQVSFAFDADNPGHWPFHCHHLYHMVTGMMAYVAYEKEA